MVTSPLPSVVDAGTKVGPTTPPPPLVMIRVDEPEMIVVAWPLMIVVIRTEVMVGSAGSVTMVRVRVAVHSHEVE